MTVCLVVEDEPAIRRLVVLALQDNGCRTLQAESAEVALEILDSLDRPPAVTITDIRLPGIDGVELARRIKADARLDEMPVLLMSAYGEPREHEGDAFLPKPFDVDEFGALVASYLPDRE